jgi:mRNA-degrading endonuclease HigB of HigAB toxin-antitoxin module
VLARPKRFELLTPSSAEGRPGRIVGRSKKGAMVKHSGCQTKLCDCKSIVSADRIVFNTKGNHYRLVVAVDFEKGIVWIKWVGTHRDYDRIDVKEVRHGG